MIWRRSAPAGVTSCPGGFYFLYIPFKYNTIHPERSSCLNIFLQVIDEKALLRFQGKCLKQITVNLRIRLCHLQRSRENSPAEIFQHLIS